MACTLLPKTIQGLSSQMYKLYNSEKKTVNLSSADFIADDTNWVMAKESLKRTLKGRQIAEYT